MNARWGILALVFTFPAGENLLFFDGSSDKSIVLQWKIKALQKIARFQVDLLPSIIIII